MDRLDCSGETERQELQRVVGDPPAAAIQRFVASS